MDKNLHLNIVEVSIYFNDFTFEYDQAMTIEICLFSCLLLNGSITV